jgi:8-oxo-dGTP pyrophosphatase MutT (NUDIX family)
MKMKTESDRVTTRPMPDRLYIAVPRPQLFDFLDAGLEPIALLPGKKQARRQYRRVDPDAGPPAVITVRAWEATAEGVKFRRSGDGWRPTRALDPHLLGCSDRKALAALGVARTVSCGGLLISDLTSPRVMLLFKQKPGYEAWKTPKGGIERKETRKQAALREVREEAGISKVKMLGKLGSIQYFKKREDGSRSEKTVHLFLMLSRDGACGIRPRRGESFVACEWLEFADAIERVTQPQVRGAIARARYLITGQ